ncbi:hypothetical protein [Goodfellowiella coeruleoviolacea]|uniref:hypothetical protein n=1 Tax=Goodfellowiella coeruleoviolacea TaxID=334858 RepID=UPI0020A45A97|nr:hypothetical protein [Goodfellowiella coeruleoviolacea]
MVGDPAGANAELERLLADRLRLLGPDHPHVRSTRAGLARWRRRAGAQPAEPGQAWSVVLTAGR